MTDLPDRDNDNEAGIPSNTRPARGQQSGTPRWVKAFAIGAGVLLVLFIVLHLSGGGFGNHTP